MRLLSKEHFAGIFDPLVAQRVAVVDGRGNAGDEIIHAATRQLLREFGIQWQTVNPFCDDIEADAILLFGGGSMGAFPAAQAARRAALNTGIPCIVLPQSFIAPEDMPYQRVFVREQASLQYCPHGILAPDLALGFGFPKTTPPVYQKGVFLRHHGHSAFPALAKVDPCSFCHTAADYVQFAAKYEHIVTDRIHLAITALGIGRRATLLPVAYHKNRSMWATWLKDLGCHWADRPELAKD